MAHVRIFLSTVTAEFRSYRDALRRDLQRPNVTVMVQEEFIPTGTETLDKLDDYIRQCDAVIHLVGDMTGAMAQEPSTALIRQRYPDFGSRLPPVADFLKPDASPLSYTQWEAWLALYHSKPLVIAVPEDGASRDDRYRVVDVERTAQQEHLQRLTAVERYPEVRFINADRLAVEVLRSKLHEILAEAGGTSTVAAYHWPAAWDFGPYMAQKREGFEGRDWLFSDIAVWLADSRSRALLVQADFGVGKSAFMAELVQRNPGGCIAAFHFCQHDTQDTLHPGYFVRSVATQLAAALPSYKALVETDATLQERLNRALEDPGSAFEGGVLGPLAKLATPSGPRLLLVDALDESLELDAETAHRSRGIVDLLGARAGRFPPWLKVLATTRSNPDVLRRLDGFAPRLIDAESAANVDDLRRYVLHCAAHEPLAEQLREAGTTAQALAELLAGKSQGKFLLAVRAVHALEEEDAPGGSRQMQLDEVAALPPGMDAWYFDAFERRYARAGRDYEFTRTVLGVLAAAREPLSIEAVAAVLGVKPAVVKAVRQLLPDFLQLRAGRLAFDHFSIAQWLTREDEQGFPRAGGYAVDLPASQAKLHDWALVQIAAETAHHSPYLLRHLASHLADDAERRSIYGRLMLGHFAWLQARLDQDGVDALVADVGHLQGHPEQLLLETLLRNCAYVLRAHPEQLAAQMLGRIGSGLGREQRLEGLTRSARGYLVEPANLHARRLLVPVSQSLRLSAATIATAVCNQVHALTVLPDGRVAWAAGDHTLHVWSPARGTDPLVLKGHDDWINALAVLDDGRIVSGADDGIVRVWEPRHGVDSLVLKGHVSPVHALAILPDGRIASGADDGAVRVWDLRHGAKTIVLERHTSRIYAVLGLPNGRLASSAADLTVRVWDLNSGVEQLTFNAHKNIVKVLARLPDGRFASGSWDGTVRIWHPRRNTEELVLEGHVGAINALVVLSDGRLVSGADDNTLRVWDLQVRSATSVFEGHTRAVRALTQLSDGRLASGADDGTVRVWNLQPGSDEPLILQGHAGEVRSLAALPDGRIASSANDDTVRIWDPQRGVDQLRRRSHAARVHTLALLSDGCIASGAGDGTVRVWDPQRGAEIHVFERHAGEVRALVALPDGRIASGADDSIVRVWDRARDVLPLEFRGHVGRIYTLAALPCGRIVSCAGDGTVRVWNPRRKAESLIFRKYAGGVHGLAVLTDGRIASGASNGSIKVWSPQHSAQPQVFLGHIGAVRVLVALPDGRMASGGNDHTVRVWNPQNSAPPLVFKCHTGCIRALAVLSDGRVVSGASDHTVRIWDPQGSSEPLLFAGHTDEVNTIAVLSDGCIVSGSSDHTVQIWDPAGGSLPRVFIGDAAVSSLAVTSDDLIVAGSADGSVHFLRTPIKLSQK